MKYEFPKDFSSSFEFHTTKRYLILRVGSSKLSVNMIEGLRFILLVSLLLGSAARSELLHANGPRACADICATCEGISTFEDGRCDCVIPEGNKLGAECINRLKQDSESLSLDAASVDGLETAERAARCSLLGTRRRLGSADVDRVANYFMNGGPLTGSSLLGRSNPDCSTPSKDQFTGASNPNPAASRPVETPVERKVETPAAPVVGAPACSGNQYQPIVSTQWLPNYGMGYPIVGAHQPFLGGYHPHSWLGAVPHMVQAIPNALMRATHIPASHLHHHHSGLVGAARNSPLLSAIASNTHGVLQRLDNMVAPYANAHSKANVVGAPHAAEAPCAASPQPSYPSSHMVGAPRVVQSNVPTPDVLQQVLAHQNTLLEALRSQLASYSPQVGAPRMHYGHPHYMLGSPHYAPLGAPNYAPLGAPNYAPLGAPNSMSPCCCPGNPSSVVGASDPNAAAKAPADSPRDEKIVSAANPESSSKQSAAVAEDNNDDESSDDSDDNANVVTETGKISKDDKSTAGINQTTYKEEKADGKTETKNKRESRLNSSIRRKRGDVKYVTRKSSR